MKHVLEMCAAIKKNVKNILHKSIVRLSRRAGPIPLQKINSNARIPMCGIYLRGSVRLSNVFCGFWCVVQASYSFCHGTYQDDNKCARRRFSI